MPIEQIVKGTTGFLSILTKRFQLLLVLMYIVDSTSVVLVFQSEWELNSKLIVASLTTLALLVATWFLSTYARNEEEELLKQRAHYATNLQKDLETHKSHDKSLGEANRMIREWQMNKPPITAKGFYPFSNGVELELKETPTGVIWVVLHDEGKPPKEYRLYKLP